VPTTLRSLTPEVLDSILSEFVFSPDSDQHEGMVSHFVSLFEKSSFLPLAVKHWGAEAKKEDRIGDLFTLAIFIGWQCRYSVEEGRRLQRLLP
jgi:hypothetical protein